MDRSTLAGVLAVLAPRGAAYALPPTPAPLAPTSRRLELARRELAAALAAEHVPPWAKRIKPKRKPKRRRDRK
jgi:hypothetical protein